MPTNRDWLFSLPLDEQLAWMNAEHDQYPKGHESLNGYEERLYDVKVSDCPYCGCERIVIHDFNDGYEEPHSYRVEHLDEREACTAGCYEMYFAFSSVEDAVKHADMRGGYKNEHPKNMYVSAEDFEWLEENLRSEHVQKLDELDNREKLEADAHNLLHVIAISLKQRINNGDEIWNYINRYETQIHELLDRQAAITAQEYRDNFTGFGLLHDLNESGISVKYLPGERRFVFDDHALVGYQAQVDSMQAKLDEVTDEWSNAIDGWHKAEKMREENERLQAELDKWHKLTEGIELPDYPMCEYQPNSRADLDAEVHYWLTSHVAVSVNVGEIEAEVMKWLDMAADIARREQGESFKSYYARKMALHGGGAADGRINELEAENAELNAERLYWKGQVGKMLTCACSGKWAEGVMGYPRPDGYTEPSLLVNDEIYSLRDFHADDQRLIAKLEADVERHRELSGELLDAAHDMQLIADRGLA